MGVEEFQILIKLVQHFGMMASYKMRKRVRFMILNKLSSLILFINFNTHLNFIQLQLSLFIIDLYQYPFHMLNRWAAYSLRMRNTRQKYYTLFRQQLKSRSTRAIANTRKKIIRGALIGTVSLITYFFCNQMYSEHLQKKKMKKKLMKAYPDQTYIISFQQDPNELLREVEIKSAEDEVNPLQNKHCVLINQQDEDLKRLKQKLGPYVIVFSPKNLDELCHVIQRCHKYRHSAIVGDYPMPDFNELDLNLLKKALNKVDEPMRKNKYVVVDLTLFNKIKIDEVNEILQVEAGSKCIQINKILSQKGFQPIFESYCDQLSVYETLINNLPLIASQNLVNKIQNLSLISAEGKRFKSSTEVPSFGQIPNLTPLFLGTGGVFAVPAKVNFRIVRIGQNPIKRQYCIQNENISDLIINWRQLMHKLSSKRAKFQLKFPNTKRIQIEVDQIIDPPFYGSFQPMTNSKERAHEQIDYVFSVNNRIIEKLLLNNTDLSKLRVKNNILEIRNEIEESKVMEIISDISVEGGVLVWCRNKEFYNKIKERTDLLEAGAQLMKKIVQIREGIDKRQVLYSHARYEKYFAKGTFRKLTQFFW